MTERTDYTELLDLLRNGGPKDWELAAQVVDGFPDGADAFLGRRWILNAIDVGSAEAVRWMLARGVELSFWDAEGRTVLEACLESDRPDRLQLFRDLIAAGANLDDRGMNGWTPLHLAAVRNDLDAIAIPLDAGADAEARTRIDLYSTPYEDAERHGNLEAAQMIRAHGGPR